MTGKDLLLKVRDRIMAGMDGSMISPTTNVFWTLKYDTFTENISVKCEPMTQCHTHIKPTPMSIKVEIYQNN